MTWLFVAIGGALGALARYGCNLLIMSTVGPGFPLATMLVNGLGSLLLGLLYGLLLMRGGHDQMFYAFVGVGVLGSFTTFSTYSLETVSLLEQGRLQAALMYGGGTVMLCLFACWLGLVLSRAI